MAILISFTVPFLRKSVGLENNVIFAYTISITFGMIVANYLIRPFADKVGSKPILILIYFMLTVFLFGWGIIPVTCHWSFFFIMGFFTIFLLSIVQTLVVRLFAKSLPKTNKVSYTSMVNMFSAVITLGAGITGGIVADLDMDFISTSLHQYSGTYFIAAFVAVIGGVNCFFLHDIGSLSVKQTATLFLSTKNLKSFIDVVQFEQSSNDLKRESVLLSIERSDTYMATDVIRRHMKSSLIVEKERALKSLFYNPRMELVNDLIKEALNQRSLSKNLAIFTLGAYHTKDVEKTLIQIFEKSDAVAQSVAAKSLARIGSSSKFTKIKKVASRPGLSLETQYNLFLAISLMDKQGEYLRNIFKITHPGKGFDFAQTIFNICSTTLVLVPHTSEFFNRENLKANSGFLELMEEAKEIYPFVKKMGFIISHYKAENYKPIWLWAKELLRSQNLSWPFFHISYAILQHKLKTLDRTNTLAMLYFLYQMLKSD